MIHPEFRGVAWRTSSYSGGNGNCVQVAFTGWRASSYSNGNGNCVQVAPGPALVGVRDSKAPDDGLLAVSPPRWTSFVAAVRRGEFG